MYDKITKNPTILKTKRQKNWGKILAIYATDRRLISKMHKVHLLIILKSTQKQLEKRQRLETEYTKEEVKIALEQLKEKIFNYTYTKSNANKTYIYIYIYFYHTVPAHSLATAIWNVIKITNIHITWPSNSNNSSDKYTCICVKWLS